MIGTIQIPQHHYFGEDRLATEVDLLLQLADIQVIGSNRSGDHIINLPRPQSRVDGNYLGTIDLEPDLTSSSRSPRSSSSSSCILLSQVPGHRPDFPDLSSSLLQSIALSMNSLHQMMKQITLKQELNLIDIISSSLQQYKQLLSMLPKIHEQYYQTATEILDHSKDYNLQFQPIHGDLWYKNILVNPATNHVGFFDFDFTMSAPVEYDLAAFVFTRQSDNLLLSPQSFQRFISNCTDLGSDIDLDLLNYMRKLRMLWIFGYWIEHSDRNLSTIATYIEGNMNSVHNYPY